MKPPNIVQISVDRMDRTWVLRGLHFTHEYMAGVDGFMNFVRDRFSENDKILCPCNMCLNLKYNPQNLVGNHLLIRGMDPTYHRWVHHGEPSDAVVIVHADELPENDENHVEVNHGEDFDAGVIEHPVEVPDNDADHGTVNHALDFDAESIEHPVELPDNSPDHGGVNHAEDFDADAIEHPVEVPVNDAYHGGVNHTEHFDANVIEHPLVVPDNDADSGGVNHAEEFVADVMEQTAEVPVNDADRSDALFADLQTAAVYQRHNLFCINDYPAMSNLSGRTARGYAAFVHCDKNAVSNHPKDQIAAIVELALHLPEEEAMLRGPVQYRWMYPVDKRLYALKHYVRKSVDLFGHGVRCTSGCDYGYFDGEIDEIVWFVLNSCDEVEQYREYVIHI